MFRKHILIWGFEQGTAPAGGLRGGAEGAAHGSLYMKVECVMLLIFCYCPTGNLVKAGVFYFSWMCFLYLLLFHSPWGILSSWLHSSMSREIGTREILLMAAPSGVQRSQTYVGNSPPLAKKTEHARKTRGLWGYWLRLLAQTWRNGLKCCWVSRHRQDYVWWGSTFTLPWSGLGGSVRWVKALLPHRGVTTQWLLVVSHLDLHLNVISWPHCWKTGVWHSVRNSCKPLPWTAFEWQRERWEQLWTWKLFIVCISKLLVWQVPTFDLVNENFTLWRWGKGRRRED